MRSSLGASRSSAGRTTCRLPACARAHFECARRGSQRSELDVAHCGQIRRGLLGRRVARPGAQRELLARARQHPEQGAGMPRAGSGALAQVRGQRAIAGEPRAHRGAGHKAAHHPVRQRRVDEQPAGLGWRWRWRDRCGHRLDLALAQRHAVELGDHAGSLWLRRQAALAQAAREREACEQERRQRERAGAEPCALHVALLSSECAHWSSSTPA